MNNNNLKSIFFHLSIILILFLALIALYENKNTMILTMSSNSPNPLHVDLYYTKAGVPFNDNKVSHNDEVSGNQYYFTLPDLKEIQYARLDPARQKREISIQKDIQILVSRWFKTSVYTADITKSEVGNQIKNYKIDENGIRFTTTGISPQLYINLTSTLQQSFRNFHLDSLFISLLIYSFILFFYKLCKTKKLRKFLSEKLFLYITPIKGNPLFLIGFLVILGSHFLDYYPFIFIISGIILIDWNRIRNKDVILLTIFLGSIYVTWFFLDQSIINNHRIWGQGLLIFIAYLLGLSIHIETLKKEIYYKKIIFYLFYGFFIAYMLSLLCSYIFLPQFNPLTSLGMNVCFPNEYKRTNVNGGYLISTIIAYYLTLIAVILPLILFNVKKFRVAKFSYLELSILLTFSLFSLYLALDMQRRVVFALLMLVFLYLSIATLVYKIKVLKYYHILLGIMILILLSILGDYFFADRKIMKILLSSSIIQDSRFQFWLPGLQAMIDYPVGGGHTVPVSSYTKLAHNTWIDIGKDFGIIPFIAIVVFFLVHVFHFIRIILNQTLDGLIKHIFVIFFICFLSIMMVEPVFTSDKTFFFYIIFFLGLFKNYSNSLKDDKDGKRVHS